LGYSFFNKNCLAMDVGELEQKVSFAHVVKQWMMERVMTLIDDGYK
jgi:hypothetical protein